MRILCRLLAAGPPSQVTHRALLALRVLSEREPDRAAIVRAGAFNACLPYSWLVMSTSKSSSSLAG